MCECDKTEIEEKIKKKYEKMFDKISKAYLLQVERHDKLIKNILKLIKE